MDFSNSEIEFDYQLDRHCSKTSFVDCRDESGFDYQLDRHCSKTRVSIEYLNGCLITS